MIIVFWVPRKVRRFEGIHVYGCLGPVISIHVIFVRRCQGNDTFSLFPERLLFPIEHIQLSAVTTKTLQIVDQEGKFSDLT
jgi:hypothetical protein